MERILNIFCHLDRLGPSYDGAEQPTNQFYYFTLNLTAALTLDPNASDNEAVIRQFLRLWNWEWNALAVRGVKRRADGKDISEEIPSADVEMLFTEFPENERLALNKFTASMEREFEKTLNPQGTRIKTERFMWSFAEPLKEKTFDEDERDWQSFIAHVSTFPAPLPQFLHLSCAFRIKKSVLDLNNYLEIAAAPIFDHRPFAAMRIPLAPTNEQEKELDRPANPLHRVNFLNSADTKFAPPYFYEWKYAAGEIEVRAYQKECRLVLDAKPDESFLDLHTQWVVNPRNGNVLQNSDWIAQFELRLADAFDMTARLLDWLREKAKNPTVNDQLQNWEDDFEQAFIASLRDLANLGLSIAPDDESLASYLVKRFGAQFEGILGFLREKDRAITLSVAGGENNWKTHLEDFVRNFEKLGGEQPVFPLRPVKNGTFDKFKSGLQDYHQGLEKIHTLLANDQALTALFVKGWDSAFASGLTPGVPPPSFWALKRNEIIAHLSELQIRKRLILGNVGLAWRRLQNSLHDANNLKTTVKAAFEDYFNNRFGRQANPESPYRGYFPRTAEKPFAAIPEVITKFFDDFISDIILSDSAESSRDDNLPEGLTIQVDQLQRTQIHNSNEDQVDYLRKIAGVGVLIRKKPQNPTDMVSWRCLNLADVFAADDMGSVAKIWQAANIPLRLSYRNELRQCTFFYNNHPLAATSPANDFSKKNVWNDELSPNEPTLDEFSPASKFPSLISYRNPYSAVATAPKLEPLIYGQDYEFAVFIVGNAGSLPQEIAARERGKTLPWRFSMPPGLQVPDRANHDLNFRRTKAIGALRIEPVRFDRQQTKEEMGRLNLPVIPENVHPIARSLSLDPKSPLILLADTQKAQNKDIWNEKAINNFSFKVRPPSVPLDIWHFWTLGEAGSKEKRIYVWGKSNQLNDVAHDPDNLLASEDKKNLLDATIDDPAVSGFEVKMTRRYSQLTVNPSSFSRIFTFPRATSFPTSQPPNGTLEYVQSKGQEVTIKAGSQVSISATGEIIVPEGEIWQIEFTPVVSDTRKFKDEKPIFKSVEMFVEVVAPFFINETEARDKRRALHEALKPEFSESENSVLVNLNSVLSLKDSIYKTDVLIQRWRWDGRPVSFFSSLMRRSDLRNLHELAKLLFADNSLAAGLRGRLSNEAIGRLFDFLKTGIISRKDTDKIITGLNEIIGGPPIYDAALFVGIELSSKTENLLKRNPAGGEDLKKLNRLLLEDIFPFVFEKSSDEPIYGFPFGLAEKDESFDGVLFSSRTSDDYLQVATQIDFVGLKAETPPTKPVPNPTLFKRNLSDSPGALFYRFAVRAHSRYEGLLKKNILLDSRMTTGRDEAERWKRLEIGCRWERDVPMPMVKLICPLTQTHASTEQTPGFLVVLDEPWYQDSLGGLAEKLDVDIIRSALPDRPEETRFEFGADPIIEMSEDPLIGKEIAFPSPVGGIGYTFDTDTQAPLFTRSSFIIPAPRIDGEIKELWWYFIKIKFRRSFDVNALSHQSETAVRSKWTEGSWVQMLPPSNQFRISLDNQNEGIQSLDVSNLVYNLSSEQFLNVDDLQTPVTILPTPSDGNRCFFSLYVLLTRKIVDALGRQNQETFVSLTQLSSFKDLPAAEKKDAIIRIVEIQSRKRIEAGDDLFQLLFPKSSTGIKAEDANARIVRVSPTINVLES